MSDFMSLAIQLNGQLASEGVSLRFEGYVETWRDYLTVNDTMVSDLRRLSGETLAWVQYFEEVLAWIDWRLKSEQNRLAYFKSFYENFPVSHSRYNQMFPKIKENYDRSLRLTNQLKLLHRHLKTQHRSFGRAHHQLTFLYETQMQKTMLYVEE